MTGQKWFHGLVAAFVGGCAGAFDSGIALILIAPETFNLNKDLTKTLMTVAVLGLLTGLKCAAAYLKQSPVPPEWNGTDRRNGNGNGKATGPGPDAGKAAVVGVILLALALLPSGAQAQQAALVDLVAAGANWNQYNSPQISGSVLYARLISGRTYSFNLVDITSKALKPFTVQTSIATGVGQHILDMGPAHVYAVTAFGVAAGGTNVGGSFTAGGCAVIPIKHSGWAIVPNVRVLKSSLNDVQAIYGIGVGWGR